jgi:hypothetical protein
MKAALVACYVLMINRDILDQAARRIEQELGIPRSYINQYDAHTERTDDRDGLQLYPRRGIHSPGRRKDRRGSVRRGQTVEAIVAESLQLLNQLQGINVPSGSR